MARIIQVTLEDGTVISGTELTVSQAAPAPTTTKQRKPQRKQQAKPVQSRTAKRQSMMTPKERLLRAEESIGVYIRRPSRHRETTVYNLVGSYSIRTKVKAAPEFDRIMAILRRTDNGKITVSTQLADIYKDFVRLPRAPLGAEACAFYAKEASQLVADYQERHGL